MKPSKDGDYLIMRLATMKLLSLNVVYESPVWWWVDWIREREN